MFGLHFSRLGSVNILGLVPRALAILRKYGTNAHVYLPGVGTVSGLTAGNYLDSAGTTAATVDNPVGLSLDALQAMTLGSELNPNPDTGAMTPGGTTAPTFSTTTYLGLNCRAITFNLSGAVSYATANAVSAAFGPAVAIGTVEVISYKISLSRALLSGEILQLYDQPHGVYLRQITAADTSAVGSFITVNGQEATSLGAGTASAYALYAVGTFSGGPITAYLTAVSFKQIPGIHATQATTANKPILRRGLLNQLTYSADASNAAWFKSTATATPGKLIEATGNAQHYMAQSIDMPDGPVTFAAIFAPAERSWATMYLGSVNSSVWFNLSTGVIGTTGASITASIASLANGYKLCVITGTQTGLGAITRGLYIADADNSNTYTGDGTSGILFGGAGLFQGTLTAQQIIDAGGIPVTTTAAASNPNAGRYSWQFDGSNDSLSLSAPLFQMSDDHCVIAGFNAAVINKYIFSQNNTAATTLVASLRIDAAGAPDALWQDDSATLVNVASSTSCIGLNTVATGVKIGNAKRLRVNGVQQGATNNTVLGATTLNTASIGSYTTAGNFQGSIYPVIAIKGTVSDADLLTLERFVGQLSGVSI